MVPAHHIREEQPLNSRLIPTIEEPSTPVRGPAILASGHRPFFLFCAVWGTAALPLWLLALQGVLPLSPMWHGHEMIFGFAVAAISGFLMAAVPKWTRCAPILNNRLLLLMALWLAGRAAMWFHDDGSVVPALVDLAYLPVFGAFILYDIVRSRNTRNYQVPAMLFGLAALNAVYHFHDPALALRVAVLIVIALVSLIGGRVIPAFTQNALRMAVDPQLTCRTPRWLDILAVPSVILVVLAELAQLDGMVAGTVSLVAALILGARMLGWQSIATRGLPLVWIMHAGYVWIPIGFALNGIAHLGGPVAATTALHAFTTGAVGVMIIAIASRAALGHSGRPLKPAKATVVAYVLVIAAAVVRVFLPIDGANEAAGLLWTAGYGLFAAVYWPILTKPRIDGQPG